MRPVLAWLPAVLVGIVAFVAARLAMMPGLGFWDTAELQTVAPLLGTAHPTGFPTYVLLGWLVDRAASPFGEPAFRMNLFAALCVAVAAAVTVDLVRVLTRSTLLGVLAGLGLALTRIVWAIGTHAEAHALHLAFVAILLRLLVAWEAGSWRRPSDRWLVAAAVVFGLAAGNHSLTLLLALPIGLFVLAVEPADPPSPRVARRLHARGDPDGRARLPRAAAPRRPASDARDARLRPPRHVGRLLVRRARASSSGAASSARSPTSRASSPRSSARTVDAFGPLAALLPLAFVATAIRRPRLRPADRQRGRDHLLLRRVVRERRYRALLPRTGR